MTDDADENVFLNIPYDGNFSVLSECLLFTVIYCGYAPLCARNVLDSGLGRMEKIAGLVEAARHGIHDLSAQRFNMPLELGYFLGCKRFGGGVHSLKRAFALVGDEKRRNELISDLDGCDVGCHGDTPQGLIRVVREFLAASSKLAVPGADHIFDSYQRFKVNEPELRARILVDADAPSYGDVVNCMILWAHCDEQRLQWVTRKSPQMGYN